MKLTGKCAEDFEVWVSKEDDFKKYNDCSELIKDSVITFFFHSVGIDIVINPSNHLDNKWGYIIKNHPFEVIYKKEAVYNSYIGAKNASFKKANELYNEKFKL